MNRGTRAPRRPAPTRSAGLLPLLLPLLLSGCIAAPADAPAPTHAPTPVLRLPAPGASAATLAEVHAVIGDAACSADDQCRTAAIGHKACGGPEAYLAWSLQRSDAAALQRVVAAYNNAQAAASMNDGRVSNCQLVDDPGALCVAGTRASTDIGTSPNAAAAGSCQLRPRSRLPGAVSR